mmetsp:Transcript_16660/g.24157  ORF Transcript_16660/g.24157 Transcript_16660/m.24157 type:complete len:304 (+) Transcript_16660:39-950(+)
MNTGRKQEKGVLKEAPPSCGSGSGSGDGNRTKNRRRKSLNSGNQQRSSPPSLPMHYAQHLKAQNVQLKQEKASVPTTRRASSGKALIQQKLGVIPPPMKEEITPITTASTQENHDQMLAQQLEVVHFSVSDEGSMRGKVISASFSAAQDEMSQMTDEFAYNCSNHRNNRGARLSNMMEDNTIQEEISSLPQEQLVLFTFSRGNIETTLNSRTRDEETMEDLVKRLQQQKGSSLLKFSMEEIRAIKAGDQEVVFLLKQIQGAKFSKEEFGYMKASDIQCLTRERPILIEIQTQEVVQGETLDVF